MSDAVPLSTPDGTVMAWACGYCGRVAGGSSYLAPVYNEEQIARMAAISQGSAEGCCKCRQCGGRARLDLDRMPFICEACWAAGADERAKREAEWAAKALRDTAARDGSLDRALDRDAALRLEEAMTELSEREYCAGWMVGLEHSLWRFVTCGPGPYGMGEIDDDDIAELKRLSEKAGGWWRWDEEHGALFVPLAEWLAEEGQ